MLCMFQEYEELNNKLQDFREREKELRHKLRYHRPRPVQSDSDGSGSAEIAKKSQSYQQILNSPIPKTSPPQIMHQPLQSPSNLFHSSEQIGYNTSNISTNINPIVDSAIENTGESNSKLKRNNKVSVLLLHSILILWFIAQFNYQYRK